MIERGAMVRYAGAVYTVAEVRGDRVVLEREDGPTRIAPLAGVTPAQPRRRSMYDGAA